MANSAVRKAAGAATRNLERRLRRRDMPAFCAGTQAILPVERPGALAGGEPPLFRDGVVIDRLDGADHLLDAEALVDQVVAGPADARREVGVLEEPDERRGEGSRGPRRDKEAGAAIVDHLGDAPDGGR